MIRKHIHSWEGGMDQDTSKRLYPKNKYYSARNVRLVSSDELIDGALHTYIGDDSYVQLPSEYSDHTIIGWGEVGKWTVLFSTKNEGELLDDIVYAGEVDNTYSGDYVTVTLVFWDEYSINDNISEGEYAYVKAENSQRYKFKVNHIEEIGGSGTYVEFYVGESNPETYYIFTKFSNATNATMYVPRAYEDIIWKIDLSKTSEPTLVYQGALKLTKDHPIYNEVTGYYLNEDVQKIYWTDNFNYLRSINISDPDINSLSPGKLDIIPDVSLSRPYLHDISGGNLPVGAVQYAYQLYRNDGTVTTFSPASGIIHLTELSEAENSDRNYMGTGKLDEDGNPKMSGKSVSIKIDNLDLAYDKIRVVNLIYTELYGLPQINIVTELPIGSNETIITDNGENYVGSISLNLFRSLGGALFTAKTIQDKDNILFAANIEESFLDVDALMNTAGTGYWDSRAYRFNANQTVKLFRNPNTTDFDTWDTDATHQYTGDDSALEDFYNAIGEKRDVANITNCPNQRMDERIDTFFNHSPGTEGYTGSVFIYQKDGQTLGGEGPNIKYEFVNDITYRQTFFRNYPRVETPKGNINQNLSDFESFKGPSNPLIAGLFNGFKSDEIYSFGIKFYNVKMQQSFVKWIGDIRFPRRHELDLSDISPGDYFGYADIYPLGIQFTIDTSQLPRDISHVQIVRCPRKSSDRTIISQGLTFFPMTYTNSTPDTMRPHWYPTARKDTDWIDSSFIQNLHKDVYLFHSPDLFYGNTIEQADWAVQVQALADPIFYYLWNQSSLNPYWIGQILESPSLNLGGNYSANPDSEGIDYNVIRYGSTENQNSVEPIKVIRQTIVQPAQSSETRQDVGASLEFTNWYETAYDGVGKYYGPHATTLVLKLEASSSNVGNDNGEGMIVDLKKERIPYNGFGYYNRVQRQYIPASDVYEVTAGNLQIKTYEGDVYVDFAEHIKNLYHDSDSAMHTRILYPVESSINPKLVDRTYSLARKTDPIYKQLQESSGLYQFKDENPLEQDKDFYIYNSIYSKQADSQISIPKPDEVLYTKSRNAVRASNAKSRFTLTDEWTNFASGNELMVEPVHGPINKLITSGNAILYFQDSSFGTLSVNERALQKSLSGAQIELGSSGVLARHDPISLEAGCMHVPGVISTNSGIYWYDQASKTFWLYRDGLVDFGKKSGMQSFFNKLSTIADNIFKDTGIIIGKNAFYDELWITINDGTYETLILNYSLDRFISYIDNSPQLYIFGKNGFFQTNGDKIRKHDQDTYQIEGGDYTSQVSFLVSPKEFPTAMYNVITWLNEKYSNGSSVHNTTIDTISFENDHQQSGNIVVKPLNQFTDYNVRRMNRVWRFDTIRDTNGQHMTDYYIKVTMKWSNQKFVLHTVEIYYRNL